MDNEHTTGFVGLTHLGIVSSICWASKFQHAMGFDQSIDLIKNLSSGKLPIREPKLQDILDENRTNIAFTVDFGKLSKCNTVFITQDITTDEENRSDYGSFYDLIEKIIPNISNKTKIVIMSQISVGTCRELKQYIKKKRPELDFELVYMVETLIIGNAVDRYLVPERIIIGTGSGVALGNEDIFLNQLNDFNVPIITMKYESAELTKLAINFYLFNSVVYSNTIADLCEAYSADMNEIIPALRLDRRIGPYAYIKPGLGVTGGNLERDMMTLTKLEHMKSLDSSLIEILIENNKTRYKWIENKLQKNLFPYFKKPKICIWGIAYKKDTTSLKNSIALKIIDDLSELASFSGYDPLVRSIVDKNIEICNNRYDAIQGAHCLVILIDSDEFKDLDVEQLKKGMDNLLVIDCVNLYSDYKEKLKDINYSAIGKG